MSAEGRAEMHRLAGRLLSAFLRMVEARHGGGPVAASQLQSDLKAYVNSPELAVFLHQSQGRLMDAAALDLMRQKRGDPFQRLMAHPLNEAFEDGRLSRDILPNYFSFLHLVLGDAREAMAARCADIVTRLKGTDSSAFSWDSFYEDPSAKKILWSVLLRIAETFRRFDARRDWFIALMQNTPHAVSLGPNAFQPLPRTDDAREPRSFGQSEFTFLFDCLFMPLRHLSPSDTAMFKSIFGAPPQQAFGHLFVSLGR